MTTTVEERTFNINHFDLLLIRDEMVSCIENIKLPVDQRKYLWIDISHKDIYDKAYAAYNAFVNKYEHLVDELSKCKDTLWKSFSLGCTTVTIPSDELDFIKTFTNNYITFAKVLNGGGIAIGLYEKKNKYGPTSIEKNVERLVNNPFVSQPDANLYRAIRFHENISVQPAS